jgi:hypothetical protein
MTTQAVQYNLSRVSTAVTAVGAIFFLLAAAVVLIPIGVLAMLPLFAFVGGSILVSLLRGPEEPRGAGRAKWNQVPARMRIESLTEGLKTAALIAHKDSTEIVFANSKANELLKTSLLGQTAESEQEHKYRIVKMNGARITRSNHPAILLRRAINPLLRARVIVATPEGDLPVEVKARKLFATPEDLGDFLLYTLRPQAG